MNDNQEIIRESMQGFLKRPVERKDVRITTYLEVELYDQMMQLKRAGISIKKVINEAVGDILRKYDLI